MKLHFAFVGASSALLHTNSAWANGFSPTVGITCFGNSPFSHQHDGTKESSSLVRPKEMGYSRLKRVPSSSLNGTGRLDQPVLHRRVPLKRRSILFLKLILTLPSHPFPGVNTVVVSYHRHYLQSSWNFTISLFWDVTQSGV